MTRRYTALAGVVFVIALLGSACGGGGEQLTHDQYQQKLDEVTAEVDAVTSAALASVQGATQDTLGALADGFRQTADTLSADSDEFNSLTPPDDAEEANGLLVSALNKLGEGFRQMGQAAENGDLAQVKAIVDAYPQSGAQKEYLTALGELAKAGYTVPPPSGG